MTVMSMRQAGDLLGALLHVGGWQNNADTIAEAFPHHRETLDLKGFFLTLDNLEVPYVSVRCQESQITAAECPALVFPDTGDCFMVLDVADGVMVVAGLEGGAESKHVPTRRGCTVIRIEKFTHRYAAQANLRENLTVWKSFKVLRRMVPGLLLAACLTNLLGLLAPLLIMVIYDQVIPSGSVDLLLALTLGVIILAASDFLFRTVRTGALAYIGQRGERALAVALFRKLMRLPMSQLQSSSVTQQIARFRQFESLRELFTGHVVTNLIDLPFAALFLAVLTYLAPSLGLLTFCLVLALILVGLSVQPLQQRRDQAAAEAHQASSTAVQDAVAHQRALADLGMRERWLARCMPLAEAAEAATAEARQIRNLVQTLSQSIVSLGTVGAIVLSAHGAVAGEISFGALIAAIALVSKVLAPVQAFQASLGQISGYRKSQRQADQVLALKEEMELGLSQSHQKTLRGAISFSGVHYRPEVFNPPLLSAVDFHFQPGEVVVLMGQSIAARSAVLDLVSGLVLPSGGMIEHDGIDIRQIARDELRKSVAYAPYEAQLFYGTVNQNFWLAAPAATPAEIDAALETMGLRDYVERLPDGRDTRLNAQVRAAISEPKIKSLTLSRIIARQSAIYLFSEPTDGLSQQRRSKFKAWVAQQTGAKTVIIATADRSFMSLADRLVYLKDGRVVVNDTGVAARKKVEAVMKAMGA